MFLLNVFGVGVSCRKLYSVVVYLRCCHISPDSANGRRTDRKKCIKCLSGGDSRLDGDEGRLGRCKERIKRIGNA